MNLFKLSLWQSLFTNWIKKSIWRSVVKPHWELSPKSIEVREKSCKHDFACAKSSCSTFIVHSPPELTWGPARCSFSERKHSPHRDGDQLKWIFSLFTFGKTSDRNIWVGRVSLSAAFLVTAGARWEGFPHYWLTNSEGLLLKLWETARAWQLRRLFALCSLEPHIKWHMLAVGYWGILWNHAVWWKHMKDLAFPWFWEPMKNLSVGLCDSNASSFFLRYVSLVSSIENSKMWKPLVMMEVFTYSSKNIQREAHHS